MTDPEIAVARPDERPALENMFQLYVHDFSEQWTGERRGELGDDGRFAPHPLDAYWREPGRVPLLLRRGGRLAGFALLNAVGHTGRPADRNMAEFFIVRKHRRSGLGTAAAHAIFSRYPGQWEAAVARRNTAALAFWRRCVSTHPAMRELEELDAASADWDGWILRFRIVGQDPADQGARRSPSIF
jgi:predicted acetyltransferase